MKQASYRMICSMHCRAFIYALLQIPSCTRLVSLVILALVSTVSISQESQTSADNIVSESNGSDTVTFSARFFERYQPNTALDMVEQLPGFRIDNGGRERGFGGTSGNILIDGRRPTAKQDQPSDILNRIPAENVGSLEIIRGAAGDIELQGQVEIVNVVLKDDSPSTIRWELEIGRNIDVDSIPGQGNVSLSDRWRSVDYNAGLEVNRYVRNDKGPESLLNASGNPVEETYDNKLNKGLQLVGNLNGTTSILDTQLNFNTELGLTNSDKNNTTRLKQADELSLSPNEVITGGQNRMQMELGVDFERNLIPDLLGKFIFLYTREAVDKTDTQERFNDSGMLSRTRFKDISTIESESIIRSEFVWTGWAGHSPQLNMELAYNSLANNEFETIDTGNGPEYSFVPGANTRVAETRGDFLLNEDWKFSTVELEYGIGAELSQIKQTGDDYLSRNFFFFKPFVMLSHTPDEIRQTRLRLERKVSQLDFNDFVSATVFEDDELALGNPNLRPETSWMGQLIHERRLGALGILKITAFHHWISDVQDLLPLTATEETPGNIGKGRRWGMIFEGTLPLERVGLDNSRIDLEFYWQDSTVTDPVTGEARNLSSVGGDYYRRGTTGSDVKYESSIDFRQDFIEERVAWGVNLSFNAERTRYKVNEIETRDDGIDLGLFAETTRWLGYKFRVEARNIINSAETRERIIYTGLRGLSPVERQDFRTYTGGRAINFSINGTF